MARKIDIVVFGATGFTGKFVVEELHKYVQKTKQFSWAIAGRSESKLKQLIANIQSKSGKLKPYFLGLVTKGNG